MSAFSHYFSRCFPFAKSRKVERRPRTIADRVVVIGREPRYRLRFFYMWSSDGLELSRPIHSFFWNNIRFFWFSTIFALCQYIGGILMTWSFALLIDAGLQNGLTSQLIEPLGIFCVCWIIRLIGMGAELTNQIYCRGGGTGVCLNVTKKILGIRRGGREKIPSGEMVSAISTDANRISYFLYSLPDCVAQILAYIFAAVFMLRVSVPLALIVLVGFPLAVLGISMIMKPLQRHINALRTETGKLTTLATDAVVGLRILRGVGGEDVYVNRYEKQSDRVAQHGIAAAPLRSLLVGLKAFAPELIIVIVVSYGIWQIYLGKMTHGELVLFYGYCAYMAALLEYLTMIIQSYTDARVSAKRLQKIASITPLVDDSQVDTELTRHVPRDTDGNIRWQEAHLVDSTSHVKITPGRYTVVVCADPDISGQLAQRLARTDDEYLVTARWSQSADIPLTAFSLAEVRSGIVLSDAVAQLFQGRLRSNLEGNNAAWPIARDVSHQVRDNGDGSGVAQRQHKDNPVALPENELLAAMHTADALDIIHGLDGGLDGHIAERGRSLSGGQRQRVALARGVARQAPVLILIEPTSAVDSHTESRIAERLYQERSGRTTVVISASPLLLSCSDEVIFLDTDGREVARGTHHELLARSDYHAVVNRAAAYTSGDEKDGEN
ncbi:ABC transporter transmembrane domain-containing protein [Trueperella sp. LYQ143]|uniref:ABC transporter transmembrane domain-containing protein n=1 Tax=unclassified Trueperella TaxID=2630174 RepID=UPI0039832B21